MLVEPDFTKEFNHALPVQGPIRNVIVRRMGQRILSFDYRRTHDTFDHRRTHSQTAYDASPQSAVLMTTDLLFYAKSMLPDTAKNVFKGQKHVVQSRSPQEARNAVDPFADRNSAIPAIRLFSPRFA